MKNNNYRIIFYYFLCFCIVFSCTACRLKSTEKKTITPLPEPETQYTENEAFGLKFKTPNTWLKQKNGDRYYYYAAASSFLMIERVEMTVDVSTEDITDYFDGISENDETLTKKITYTKEALNNYTVYRGDYSIRFNEENFFVSAYLVTKDKRVYILSFLSEDMSVFGNQIKKILQSISIEG